MLDHEETPMRVAVTGMSICLALLSPGHAPAQDVYAYPSSGQTEEETARDKEQCHAWAVGQTGVDPEKLAAETAPSAGATGGGLGGAGLGAARGAMSGDAAGGAVRGVGVGRLIHAVRARRQMEEQHESAPGPHQERQMQLQKYDRAFGACLTGRGYTVQ
jgi:hypothetical protein